MPKNSSRRCPLLIVAACLLAAAAGCSSESKLPKTIPASGEVLLDGAPVAEAEVSFNPLGGQGARAAHATTDARGHFRLLTYFGPGSEGPGALPGEYAVTIRKIPKATGIIRLEAGDRPPANELPEQYASPKTSGISAKVAEGEKNEFRFELAR